MVQRRKMLSRTVIEEIAVGIFERKVTASIESISLKIVHKEPLKDSWMVFKMIYNFNGNKGEGEG